MTGHRRRFSKQTALRRQTESFEGLDEDENMSGIIDRLARIEKQSAKPKPSLTCYFCGRVTLRGTVESFKRYKDSNMDVQTE